ncbi:metallophosphoesterase [Clostridium folliculivorans]|uniref:Phosphohydrolase n=1 Tax=Clostridium folliculivorans TaxID=2886038 RepID=A0A9W5Y553_9CLOT|nr:metallophosphoesterase [Clostridium folliculivorans]GKU26904.1 phosphohydrolase [Clostridium folliculivorans]GKU31555.1 phosphohydrolase [Clostridium folliculivorans]
MNYKIVLFIIAFFGIYALSNYYIGTRIYKGIAVKIPVNSIIFWGVFWVVAVAYIVTMLLGNYVSGKIFDIFNLIGVYWIGIFFYLIIILPVVDIIAFINRRYSFIPNMRRSNNLLFVTTLMIVLFIAFVMIYGTWNGSHSYVKKYELEINKNVEGMDKLNVVMVSDIHLGNLIDGKRASTMVEEINRLNPDIVLFAGDIVDTEVKPFINGNMAAEFKNINSKYGTYAALGNHDIMRGEEETITKELGEYGVQVLRDEVKEINNQFYVVGRDDISINRSEKKRKSIDDILQNVDKTKPVLLIDHTPSALEESEENDVDIQVSGHTHKGQFFPNNLITSRIFEVDYGYLKKKDLNVIVSSGYGTWGPPIRLGSRSEIVNITVKFNK